jgi:hypothetical protein
MVVSFFNDGVSGEKMVLPGATQLTDTDLTDWREAFAAYMQDRLDTEGQGRTVIGTKISVVSTDRWIFDVQVSWPDGRSASSRHTVLFAKFNCSPGYSNPRIASLGGVPLSQV